jgi:ABC-2 type transport system ATP-binding protein
MSVAVELVELTKVFEVGFAKKRPVTALDRLSIAVDEGEVVGLIGPSGAGKTTIFRLLVRLVRPTSGTARILGESIESVAMHRHVGYLPDPARFYDYLTPRELLSYFGGLAGVDARAARADELLDRVGLAPEAFGRRLRKLSPDMQQRVGLAQALVGDPKVLLLDEPMSSLDPDGRRLVRDLIAELRDAGTTVLFASSATADVEALCDRVAVLDAGRLVETGPLSEILARHQDAFEIVATAGDEAATGALHAEGFDVTRFAGGLHVRVADEAALERALERLRASGGRLVSVNRVNGER